MLQGKQVDRLVAKVMRLGDVYGQLVVRKEVPQKVFVTTNNSTQEVHDGLQWGSDFTYADFWFEDHACDFDATGTPAHTRRNVFQSEPQLWYAVGQHFGVKNLSVGTEFELSQHFGDQSGFKCRPCVGVKWDF